MVWILKLLFVKGSKETGYRIAFRNLLHRCRVFHNELIIGLQFLLSSRSKQYYTFFVEPLNQISCDTYIVMVYQILISLLSLTPCCNLHSQNTFDGLLHTHDGKCLDYFFVRGECQCTMYKITDNLRQENNVNQNEYHHIVRHYTDICKNMIKK